MARFTVQTPCKQSFSLSDSPSVPGFVVESGEAMTPVLTRKGLVSFLEREGCPTPHGCADEVAFRLGSDDDV